ncbi:MAG TPA: hypothetical protein VJY65_02960 [Chloroflexota bacterium]|nr:hypothetical protein [Chloroflexota bacterium]
MARFSDQPAAVRHQQTALGRRPAADGEVGQGRFYTHRLPNGLQLLGQYMPEVQSVSACFYVNTGARDEDPEIMGVSHFL